jgi:TolA-binding protein
MNNSVKIALYILLAVVAGISGYFALTSFGQLMERGRDRHADLEQIEPERKIPVEEPSTVVPTNSVSSVLSSNTAVLTNAPGTIASAPTNTNQIAAVEQTTNEPAPVLKTSTPVKAKGSGRIGLWTALFVVSVIGLGLLIASDVSHYMGNKALKTLYNEEGDGIANPEYEKAEEVWARGNHLEAVSMMREYLKKNPREQHVAIRIAEIYEKDLKNHLAAALEYEEVLKHKLHPDRWGWSAIHLCNLYFKLNQEQKAYPLLRRIVNEYPTTPAAEKARKRLEQVDGVAIEQIQTESQVAATPTPPPAGSLPPGFRPRK